MFINIYRLIQKYPNLRYHSADKSNTVVIDGTFQLFGTTLGNTYDKTFSILVEMVDDANQRITIKETDGKIDRNYPHINKNGTLCLGVETEIILRCVTEFGFDIYKWFEEFVVPYFSTYEYFKEFGRYPFGQYRHGNNGILEFYMEFFNVDNLEKAKNCLLFSGQNRYRGHWTCPCGSRKRIRYCHRKELFKAQKEPYKSRIIKDCKEIMKG